MLERKNTYENAYYKIFEIYYKIPEIFTICSGPQLSDFFDTYLKSKFSILNVNFI